MIVLSDRLSYRLIFYFLFISLISIIVVGYVAYSYSRPIQSGEIEEHLEISILAVGLFMGFFSMVAAFVLTRDITNPIDKLVESTRKIASGDIDSEIKSERSDELGELASALDSMRAEIRHRRGELEKAYEELMEVDRLKDDFLAMTSHELKTPLTSIIGLTQVLKRKLGTRLQEDEMEDINIILEDSNYLKKMIEELLELSRLEAGKEIYKKEPINPADIVEQVVHDLKPYAKQNNVRIEVDIDSSTSQVYGDKEALSRLLNNLANNAIKFTSGKGDYTRVGVKNKGDDVSFFVRDNGLGIPANMKEKIFERFFQVEAILSRKYGGTGLGLAICKKIAENHKGRILVESELRKGSTFYFLIPKYTKG
ncbi:MAG: HAMP domain-containing sensor histidine kinase [Candidatus Altiarchaeota archaeon]